MRTICALLFTAACLASPVLRAAEDEAPKPEVEPRVYDVSSLLVSAKDYPGPDLTLASHPDSPAAVNAFAPVPAPVNTASVADMIRSRVEPTSWDPQHETSIEERAGVLVVMQSRAVHAKIAAQLDTFGKDQGKQLAVQGLLVHANAEGLPAFLGRAGKTVSDDAVQALLKASKPKAMPQLLVPSGARSHLFSGTARAYVQGAGVSGDTLDPVVRDALDGLLMDVRPTLSADGQEASVELRMTLNANLKIESGGHVDNPLAPGEDEAPATLAEAHAEFQRATVQTRQVRKTVQVPVGRWVLCGILTPGGASATATEGGADLLLLLVNAP